MIEDFSGQVLADKYRIDSVWREAAAGKLYRATHLLMEKPVTVKILSPSLARDAENVRRFAQEARTVSHISHPNILNVTDFGSDKSGVHFIVLEDAGNSTLREAIRSGGNFPLERAVRITRQIAAALTAAQNASHPNLTSENVLLTDETADIVKVFGFGATETDENAGFDDSFSERAAYFAPEQFSAATQIDARTNVYNLGIILYEMLAGEVPFVGEKPTDLMLKHEQEPPPPLSAFRKDLPDEINRVILSALAKNPDLRYQTAKEFADALERVTPVSAISAHHQALAAGAVPVDDGAQNNLWKTAFIVLAGVAVLSTFFIYMTQVKQTDPATALPTDANGQPVQPANPATGTGEQMLSNMSTYTPDAYTNSNIGIQQPGVLPGGDGYDPWARGGAPPPGAPNYGAPYPVQPGGQQVYVDPGNGGSIFMPRDDGTYVMVPVNPNANANANVQTPRTRQTPAANTQTNTSTNTAKPVPTPASNTATPKQTPAPPKPTPQPKTTATPSANEKRSPSGKEQDS